MPMHLFKHATKTIFNKNLLEFPARKSTVKQRVTPPAGMMGAFETHSFMASITVHCPRCQSNREYRHGKTPTGHAHYRCPACAHVFQLTYIYEAHKPDVKDKTVDTTFNGAGVRDADRVLKIGTSTVLRTLKNSPQGK